MSNEVEKITRFIHVLRLFLQIDFTGCAVEGRRCN